MYQPFSSLPLSFTLLLYFFGGGSFLASAVQSPQATDKIDTPAAAARQQPIHVASNVLASKLIHRVEPVYPEEARKARIQGSVVLQVTVNEKGEVSDVKIISGHALLKDAAANAVRQWRYTPVEVNGEPAPAVGSVMVQFFIKGEDNASEKPPLQTGSQPREMPADMKAYTEAARISDPQKKLEALQKFLVAFPNSQGAAYANQAILEVMVKNWPDKKDQIQAQADNVIKAANGPGRAYLLNNVATTMMEAGMVDLAEEFASKGLAAIDEEVRPRRAASLAILGRVWLKKGKTTEAEKALKEAFDADPSVTDAAVGLAELAEKSGNDAVALDYLATAALTGKMKSQSRKQLEALYRKSHSNTLDGLEAILDAKYKNLYPNPVRVEAYKPTAARGERVVLAEVFSGAGCPPCVAADLAMDAVMERYPRKDVAVLVYHLHIPQPDPLTNPSTEARAKFYEVRGVPSVRIDGAAEMGAGGDRGMIRGAYDRFTRAIDHELEVPVDVRLKLEASLQGSNVNVRATVEPASTAGPDLKLQIALVEEEVRYSGENGIRFHTMVVRSLAGPQAGGLALDASQASTVEHQFDLDKISAELKAHLDDYEVHGRHGKITFSEKKNAIDPRRMSIVAFVQNEKSKQVLQAAYVQVKPIELTAGK